MADRGVTRRSTPFVLMCMTTFVWQGTWAFLFQTSQPDVARVLAKVGYLFIMFLPTTFYHFVTATVARRNERPLLLASYAISAVLAVLLLTGNEVVDGVRQFALEIIPAPGVCIPCTSCKRSSSPVAAAGSWSPRAVGRLAAGTSASSSISAC
jgi:hypothetical protein